MPSSSTTRALANRGKNIAPFLEMWARTIETELKKDGYNLWEGAEISNDDTRVPIRRALLRDLIVTMRERATNIKKFSSS